MIKNNRIGPLCMVAASLCWSLGGLSIKFIPWSGMSIIGLRALLAAIVFTIYRRSIKIQFTKGNMLAGVCLSSTTIMYVFANQLTTAAAAILLQFTSPIFILLFRFVFYRKIPKPAEAVAVIATILGMLLFFADELSAGGTLGNLLAIGSGVAFAGVIMCNQRPDTVPEHSIMLGFLINATIWTPFAFFDPNITADPVAWGFLALMGIVQVGLAYIFFSIGIKRTSALLACLTTALEPVLNPLWVALATPERPGRFALAGGAVIIIAIVGYNIWAEKQRGAEGEQK